MSKETNSRRKFIKKAAYVAPVVLILGGLNSHASDHASGLSHMNVQLGNGNHFGDQNGNHFGDQNGNHFGDQNGNHFGRNN
jgi:hypothetical protein